MSDFEALVLTDLAIMPSSSEDDPITAALRDAKIPVRLQQPEAICCPPGTDVMSLVDNSQKRLTQRDLDATGWIKSMFVVIDERNLQPSVVANEVKNVANHSKPAILMTASDQDAEAARLRCQGCDLIRIATPQNLGEIILRTAYEAGATLRTLPPSPWLVGIDREQLRYILNSEEIVS